MEEKFQADTKELDEKFAAISENLKKQYDRHRFIRRVIIGYYSSAATTIYFSLMLMFFLDLLFSNIGIESSSKIFRDIRDVAIIVLPICATICFLRYTKTKRYSNLFIKDQGDSLLVFTIENFASIVLLLYPTLIFTGILEGAAAHIFLYALIVVPICGIVFGVCYFFNTGSYTPKDEA